MEDEECLPENSGLKTYLQSIGYSDVEVTKNVDTNTNCINFVVPKSQSKWTTVESIDEDVIEGINILISSQMLFEEDVANVEKLLSNFKVVKNGILKSMFQGVSGVVILILGLLLYWIIGSYTFIIVSSFYSYKVADYLWRTHFNKIRLRKLKEILQGNFILIKKIVNFVEENNKFVESNNSSHSYTNEFNEGFDFYKNFKHDILSSMNDMINILSKSTQKMIKIMPLYDYIENPQCYICNNLNKGFCESMDLFKLYQIYLLIQSEFLQRLILTLIPNLSLTQGNSFQKFNKIVTETSVNLMRVKSKLNKKFKFIFLNGVHYPKTKMELKLPVKNKSSQVNYTNEFISSIHDTSNTFQNLLIKSRSIEENVKSEKIPEYIEEELVNIQNDLNTCQRNVADSFILFKKANALTLKPDDIAKVKEDEIQKSDEKINEVILGYSDLDPKIEDEIFEAYFTDEKLSFDLTNIDDWDFEDRLKKKLEKEYSQNVIKELKTKLVEKAKNWEKRERELLKKKFGYDPNLEQSDEKNDESRPMTDTEHSHSEIISVQSEEDESNIPRKCLKMDVNLLNSPQYQNEANTTLKTEQELSNKNSDSSDNIESEQSYMSFGNSNFLSEISQARQRILKVSNPVQEEELCWEFEDSDGEKED